MIKVSKNTKSTPPNLVYFRNSWIFGCCYGVGATMFAMAGSIFKTQYFGKFGSIALIIVGLILILISIYFGYINGKKFHEYNKL